MPSYYDTLRVDPTVTDQELKRAYRVAVKATHPDVGGTADTFTRVQAAWEVLGDPARRAAYDLRNIYQPVPGDSPSERPATQAGAPPAPRQAEPTDEPEWHAAATVAEPPRARRRPQRHISWRRALQTACAITAMVTGVLAVWAIGQLGRVPLILAIAYLVTTAALLGLRFTGRTMGERIYRRLLRAAWTCSAALACMGLINGLLLRHDPVPLLIWGGVLGAFAASVTTLWATQDHEPVTPDFTAP